MKKAPLLRRILTLLEEQHQVMTSAAAESTENATGEQTKSEGKYDTRAVEAAYLAGAQQERADKLAEAVHLFRSLELPDYELTDAIGPGALVEADQNGDTLFFLLAPAAGGLTIEHLGCELTVLAPDAPLYQALLGQHAGGFIDSPALMLLGVE
jgi:hypothetical protein